MYIEEKYWGNYIGGTDDSLLLLEYLIDKQKTEISLSEIFADTGLDKLNWDFHKTEPTLVFKGRGVALIEGVENELYYAIDVVTDLAALMLECSVNGSVSVGKLRGLGDETVVRITFTEEEKNAMNKALSDFVKAPLTYDLHEMVPDESMLEMAQDCENLRKELCG
ncbi:MAG: imm68 putative immunity domain-containing protein [Roseburia sp.]|nr:imm68 putative immunity domain-containing protein [Roseburia sp.]